MTNRQENPTPRENLLVVAVFIISLILVALCAAGCCTTKVVEHIVHQRDTTYIEHNKVDSLYKRDSVYIREKNDTIYIYKERVREKYLYKRDTIHLLRVDSVAVERIIEVERPAALSAWQRAKLSGFWWLCGGLLVCLAWIFRKPLLGLLRRLIV